MQDMPSLPAELWREILGLTVRTPDLFETKWDYSPDILIWHGWESPESTYRDSLRTKISICQVSSSWREIGVELLYEHLFLAAKDLRSHILNKLLPIFEMHAADPIPSGYGRSTKRVDIHFEAFSGPLFQCLCRLLNCCHNIRIFNIIGRGVAETKNQFELSSILQNRFSHSLRRMRYYADYSNSKSNYFPDVPLDAFELSTGPILPIHPPAAISTVSTLSLELYGYQDEPPSWRFPALRHLTLRRIDNLDIPSLRPFMTAHGPQLHSLHLVVYGLNKLTHLPELLALTTNLRCLALSPAKVHWPPSENSFPSITHIGLHSHILPRTSDMVEFIYGSVFPSLRCVRLLDHYNPVGIYLDPAYKDVWMSLLEAGAKRSIRFEDNKCQLIQIMQPPNRNPPPTSDRLR